MPAKLFLYQGAADAPETDGESVLLDKWYEPDAEPLRQKPVLTAAHIPEWLGEASLDETVFVDVGGWVPHDPGPMFGGRLTQYQSEAAPIEFTPPVAPEMDSWYEPDAEPVRTLPPRIPNLGVEVYEVSPTTVIEPGITMDRWWQPDAEPVRTIPPRVPGLGDETLGANPDDFTEPVPFAWFVESAEPVRQPPSPFISMIAESVLAIPPSISVVVTCVEFRDGAFSRITFDAESLDGLRFTDDTLSRVTFTSEGFC